MAMTRKEERELLGGDELQVVVRTRHPEIRQVPDGELAGLKSTLKEKRDAARQVAARQRSEVRGRGSSRPDSREDAGARRRLALLSQAMQRLNREFDRRMRGGNLGAMMDEMWDTVSGEEEQETERKKPKARSRKPGPKSAKAASA